MVVIDEAHLRQLASLDLGRELVTTCYLDLDERRLPRDTDIEAELDRVLRDGRARAKGDASVLEDLRRIEAHVRGGLQRGDIRGMVIVCSSTASLWEAIPVPVGLRSQLVVSHVPALGQLEALVLSAEVIAVVLTDGRRSRIVVWQMGSPLLTQDVPGPAAAVADALLALHRDQLAVGAVALAGPDDALAELEAALDPELARRRVGRLATSVDAPLEALRGVLSALECQLEADRETALVRELRAELTRRGGAVAGLPATLHALSAGRVDHLLVSAGYQATGWRSPDGSVLAAVGPRCELCSEMMVRADDVVEDAIELALRRRTRVTVLAECDDLDVLGHIGGLVHR